MSLTKKNKLDYILVGQGLAGTLLTKLLLEEGYSLKVLDRGHTGIASNTAAGLINPITGRRYVKSWKIDDLLPYAKAIYQDFEKKLGISIYKERNIIRTLFNSREENDWLIRAGTENYLKYIEEEIDIGLYAQYSLPAFSYGEVKGAAQVDLPLLISTYRQELLDRDLLWEENFAFDQIFYSEDGISYKGLEAKGIIFCEGVLATQNPFFNYLPFGKAKGEVLIIKIPGIQFQKSLKHRIFISPLGKEKYWVGSTYEWKYKDALPSEEGKSFLINRLNDLLKVPYEILEHKAAIRPTVKDRRPLLGVHPEIKNFFIFNGLGTKGASLGPYWAKAMLEYLKNNKALDKEVNIKRFEKT